MTTANILIMLKEVIKVITLLAKENGEIVLVKKKKIYCLKRIGYQNVRDGMSVNLTAQKKRSYKASHVGVRRIMSIKVCPQILQIPIIDCIKSKPKDGVSDGQINPN